MNCEFWIVNFGLCGGKVWGFWWGIVYGFWWGISERYCGNFVGILCRLCANYLGIIGDLGFEIWGMGGLYLVGFLEIGALKSIFLINILGKLFRNLFFSKNLLICI